MDGFVAKIQGAYAAQHASWLLPFLILLIVPVMTFFVAQRFFMRGIVVSGVEK
jgi:ABC-type glycerol-3-phosphate transport system permease component